jgi:hypothetical protein
VTLIAWCVGKFGLTIMSAMAELELDPHHRERTVNVLIGRQAYLSEAHHGENVRPDAHERLSRVAC